MVNFLPVNNVEIASLSTFTMMIISKILLTKHNVVDLLKDENGSKVKYMSMWIRKKGVGKTEHCGT